MKEGRRVGRMKEVKKERMVMEGKCNDEERKGERRKEGRMNEGESKGESEFSFILSFFL